MELTLKTLQVFGIVASLSACQSPVQEDQRKRNAMAAAESVVASGLAVEAVDGGR